MHAQSCLTLCNPMDCSLPGPSSSWGFSRQVYWSGLPCPPPRDLPDPGIEPASLMSPALVGGFFITSANWEAPSVGVFAPKWNGPSVSYLWSFNAGVSSQVTSRVVLYHLPHPWVSPRKTLQQDLALWAAVIWPHLSRFHRLALPTSSSIPTHSAQCAFCPERRDSWKHHTDSLVATPRFSWITQAVAGMGSGGWALVNQGFPYAWQKW